MSKLIYAGLISAMLMIAACKDAHKTGGATQDSSASHGYSGAAHPEKNTGMGEAAGTSGTSDTSKKDSNKNQPTDTSKHIIH